MKISKVATGTVLAVFLLAAAACNDSSPTAPSSGAGAAETNAFLPRMPIQRVTPPWGTILPHPVKYETPNPPPTTPEPTLAPTTIPTLTAPPATPTPTPTPTKTPTPTRTPTPTWTPTPTRLTATPTRTAFPFDGSYSWSYIGSVICTFPDGPPTTIPINSGPLPMTVLNGQISGDAGGPVVGTVSSSGSATFGVNANGASITWLGTFVGTGSAVQASGTWSGNIPPSCSGSGTWSGSRQ
jgi:hypothetical protein